MVVTLIAHTTARNHPSLQSNELNKFSSSSIEQVTFLLQIKIMGYIYDLRTQELRNLECPFCKKETLKAVYYPSILQMKKSRSAAWYKNEVLSY